MGDTCDFTILRKQRKSLLWNWELHWDLMGFPWCSMPCTCRSQHAPLVKSISFWEATHINTFTLQSAIQCIYTIRDDMDWTFDIRTLARKELTLQCAAMRPLVLHDAPDPPQYFILGGLVFVPLTESLLMDDFGISARLVFQCWEALVGVWGPLFQIRVRRF